MSNPVNAVVAALVIAILLVIGGLLVGNVAQTAEPADAGATSVSEPVLLGAAGDRVTIDTLEGVDETVYNSRGRAINFSGAPDSYVESDSSINFSSDGTYTTSVWARVDDGVTTGNRTVVQVENQLTVLYNASNSDWTARLYDPATRDTYQVSGDAPQQAGNWTHLVVVRNDTHLAMYRNTTLVDSVDTSAASGDVDGALNTTNFDGRVDEIRVDDDALNASQRQRLYDTPVGPLRDTNRTARIMFDRPTRANQLIFFTSAGLVASNATGADGLPGSEMNAADNTLFGTVDYRWYVDGPEIQPVAGGRLDAAPVAYVDYTQRIGPTGIVTGFADAMAFAALIPIVLVAMAVVGIVSRFG